MQGFHTIALVLTGAIVIGVIAGPSLMAETPDATSTRTVATFRDCPECPEMLVVPAGTFLMGSSPADIASAVSEGMWVEFIRNETPQHDVTVEQFAMSVTEVTRDQFDAFVRATGYEAGGPCWVWNQAADKRVESIASSWRDPGFSQGGNHPVVCVNWNDAKAYVRWLSQKTGKNYRLPTEAEWEYAARAGTATPRYWGWDNSSGCSFANLFDFSATGAFDIGKDKQQKVFQCTDGYVYTAPVAQFQANAFGLKDMLGNVWEWTEDCYNKSYNGVPTNGTAWLTGDCSRRVDRGGSWFNGPWGVRSAKRDRVAITDRGFFLGIRVARAD